MAGAGTAPHASATQVGCGWVDENALAGMLGEDFAPSGGPSRGPFGDYVNKKMHAYLRNLKFREGIIQCLWVVMMNTPLNVVGAQTTLRMTILSGNEPASLTESSALQGANSKLM